MTSYSERFWSKVDIQGPDDCWEWQGGRLGLLQAYGSVSYKNKTHYAHRIAYMLAHDYLPNGKRGHVCHTCDNKLCCNPRHLFLGDNYYNHVDHSRKGLYNDRSRLNEEAVKVIKWYLREGVSPEKLARLHNVSVSAVKNIKNAGNWAWVKI